MLSALVNAVVVAIVGLSTAPANMLFADPRMDCEVVHVELTSRTVSLAMPRCVRNATAADDTPIFVASSVVEIGVFVELPR